MVPRSSDLSPVKLCAGLVFTTYLICTGIVRSVESLATCLSKGALFLSQVGISFFATVFRLPLIPVQLSVHRVSGTLSTEVNTCVEPCVHYSIRLHGFVLRLGTS
jgi:hypothetical protein